MENLAFYVLVALALIFAFLIGVHDSSNIVATMISSRSIGPRRALALTAVAEFLGPFLFGVAVANTIGHEIADQARLNLPVLLAALIAAITWNLLTWWWGIPSSSSHALIGGLLGAVIVSAGLGAVYPSGLVKILIALFFSPVIGLFVGYTLTRLVFFLARNASWRINILFKRAQLLTATFLALSHGANDAPKTMGLITLGLVISGQIAEFRVPLWVMIVSAAGISLGTLLSGWRLIRTLGSKFYRIRPVDGFAVQSSSALVIIASSLLGGPVSTTQVVSSAILGVGAAERMNKVRWGVAGDIGVAWLITIPINGLLAAGVYLLLRQVM